MNKLLLVALAVLLVLGAGLYMFMPRCEEPQPLEVALTQLRCAQAIDIAQFRADACEKLHGVSDCQFEETDKEAVYAMFGKIVDECAVAALKADNKCVDKYEGVR